MRCLVNTWSRLLLSLIDGFACLRGHQTPARRRHAYRKMLADWCRAAGLWPRAGCIDVRHSLPGYAVDTTTRRCHRMACGPNNVGFFCSGIGSAKSADPRLLGLRACVNRPSASYPRYVRRMLNLQSSRFACCVFRINCKQSVGGLYRVCIPERNAVRRFVFAYVALAV